MPKRLQLNTYPKATWKDVTNTEHCNCYKRTKHILSEFGLKCWKWRWKSVNPRWRKITNIRDHNNILNYLFHKRLSVLRNESKRRLSRLKAECLPAGLMDLNHGDDAIIITFAFSMCMRFEGKALNIQFTFRFISLKSWLQAI